MSLSCLLNLAQGYKVILRANYLYAILATDISVNTIWTKQSL